MFRKIKIFTRQTQKFEVVFGKILILLQKNLSINYKNLEKYYDSNLNAFEMIFSRSILTRTYIFTTSHFANTWFSTYKSGPPLTQIWGTSWPVLKILARESPWLFLLV